MNLSLNVCIAVLIAWSPSLFAQKVKYDPAPPTVYPMEKTFAASCDTVWPLAVQSAMAEGWSVKTSDRAGGILTLEWTKGEWRGLRFTAPQIIQNTLEPASWFSHQWNTFRIVSASVISAPEGAGCKYVVNVVMQGDENTKGWRVLQSRGFLEYGLLMRIDGRFLK